MKAKTVREDAGERHRIKGGVYEYMHLYLFRNQARLKSTEYLGLFSGCPSYPTAL